MQAIYLKRFKKVHGFTYDYSKFKYTGSDNLSTIICRIHGDFQQSPYTHSKGHGCKKCAIDYSKIRDLESRKLKFSEQFNQKFGNKLTLILDTYISNGQRVSYNCNSCQSKYTSTPNKLLSKASVGCAVCYGNGKHKQTREYFEKYKEVLSNQTGYLYLVKLKNDNEEFIKIGITKYDDPLIRLERVPYQKEILLFIEDSLYNCFDIEQQILSFYKKQKYRPKINFGGHTECLSINESKNIEYEIKYKFFEKHEIDFE